MNRNDSPRSYKLFEIIKEIFFNKNILDNFSNEFKESLITEEEIYVKFILI